MFQWISGIWLNITLYFSSEASAARQAASAAMSAALQNDDLAAYRKAAAAFLDPKICPSAMSLPEQFFWVVLTPKNHLVDTENAGIYDDVIVENPHEVPIGCRNPIPGVRNVTEPYGR